MRAGRPVGVAGKRSYTAACVANRYGGCSRSFDMVRVLTRMVCGVLLLGASLYGLPGMAQPADAALEQDRLLLRLLSCQLPWAEVVSPSVPVGLAVQRMEALGKSAAAGGVGDKTIAGPLLLGRACLQNVHFGGAAGSFWVSGQVCQPGIDDFVRELRKIGVALHGGKLPPALAALPMPASMPRYWAGTDRQFYLLLNGSIELAGNGLRLGDDSALSFFCMLRPPAEYEQR